jgi:glycosyltransferase involved in cell wall biosynthesis
VNIALLIAAFPPDRIGGAELQAQKVARELSRAGHEVTVYTRSFRRQAELREEDGYRVWEARRSAIPALSMLLHTWRTLRQLARQKPRPDVLLCYQTLNAGFIGVIAQKLLGIPAVVSIRGNREYRLQSSLENRLLVAGIYRRARYLLVQTPRMQDDLQEQLVSAGHAKLFDSLQGRLRIIPNGVDMPPADSLATGNTLLFVGRLIPGKGVADLLEALRPLRDFELVIVGDGPDRARLQLLADGMPVTFVGEVAPPRVRDFLKQARVLVLPSQLGDGLPNVILEAMSCGVPVVATRTAGVPDVVHDGQNGLLHDVRNVDELRGCLQRLLENPSLCERLGRQAQQDAHQYQWDNVIPQLESVLEEAVRPMAVSSPTKLEATHYGS